jgi:hypothetical protein
MQFLKKKQNNLPKTTSVSSEEQTLKDEIAKWKTKWEESLAKKDALSEEYENYLKVFLKAQ